jgi:glycosyltransferase involved in cell wall biosynthesis
MTDLSVVLISKNQDWNIARLVESVLSETDFLSGREIILVDSASTDGTTEIASHYPITVLKLRPEQRLTAAAGRYVGYEQTTGDLVLFLDGDMELCSGWLEQALQVMRTQPDAAVITGKVIDRLMQSQGSGEKMLEPLPADTADIINVRQGGGAAIYRRCVLDLVGTFNPYLYSDEEPELCLRIRYAGYRILRLSRPIVYHYSAPAEALSTLLGRRSRNLWLGFGQNIRYYLGSSLLWPYLRERGWALAPALILCLGIIAAASSGLTGQWECIALWGVFVSLLMTAIAIQKHSLKRALFTLFQRLLILDGTVRGLLLKPYDPAGYSGMYEIIQSIRNRSCK